MVPAAVAEAARAAEAAAGPGPAGAAGPPAAGGSAFEQFLGKMRAPEAADLVKAIKGFLQGMEKAPPDPAGDAKKVQDFFRWAEAAFRAHALWKGAGEEGLEAAGEALEKYVMTKLYTRTFGLYEADRERDEVLASRLRALQTFVEPAHLDIPEHFSDEECWALAQHELLKMNSYKAPKDKLICILNCCRIINNLLAARAEQLKGKEAAGADDFLPVLIYVLIKAAVEDLESNLQYIMRFRAESRMNGEAAYFYTNLVSGTSFVETIDAESLSMEPAVFIAHMRRAGIPGAELPAELAAAGPPADLLSLDAGPSPLASLLSDASPPGGGSAGAGRPTPPPPPPPAGGESDLPSVEELEALGRPGVLSGQGELVRKYPLLHAVHGDLRIQDVERLLTAFKELALRYESLAQGVEHARARAPAAPAAEPAGGGAAPGAGSLI